MKKEDFLNADFLKQFHSGDELSNFLKEIQRRGIEQLLEAELDSHLGYEKHNKSESNNCRNGHTTKKIKGSMGEINISVPRDRNSSFEPVIVPKKKNMVDGIEDVIISLYTKGMSNADIEDQMKNIYNLDISTSTISRITERISEDIKVWQNRPLDETYLIVWMDGIVFKVRENSRVVNKTVYIAVGLKKNGLKEVLGLWLGQKESSSFWMSVLSDIKARGVKDIFITVTDNLNGFTNTIKAIFPKATTQICVVHQIRNACKYVTWKERREFSKDMKAIYDAVNVKAAEEAFEYFANKWEKKYKYAVNSWRNNWNNLTAFFDFPPEIRSIIYTTNLIENLNGKIRKYTKNKLSFPTDLAVMKSVFLTVIEISEKWKKPIQNWNVIINQFIVIFEERMTENL